MKYGIYSLKKQKWLSRYVLTPKRVIGTSDVKRFQWCEKRTNLFDTMTSAAEVGEKIPADERVRLVSEIGNIPKDE